jgi:hypothetical protein
MSARRTIADADGEIAALIYAGHDRPDLVLCAFARHLADAGRRVCGLVQLRDCAPDGASARVMVLERWQVVDVVPGRDAAGGPCRLDAGWLDEMGAHAEASIRRGIDAVIVNRFGPRDAAGRGFRDAILAASEMVTPLVVAVPAFEFERWTRFSGGMTVRLDCTLASLLGWWRGISRATRPAAAFDPRACELLK